mmetsp:Transcript_13846/g.41218  ORF Transcript_13846/g.41218 Transcript_13846/m.41218 type:complete len:333 (+) Transcript_13846:152-1150(+)
MSIVPPGPQRGLARSSVLAGPEAVPVQLEQSIGERQRCAAVHRRPRRLNLAGRRGQQHRRVDRAAVEAHAGVRAARDDAGDGTPLDVAAPHVDLGAARRVDGALAAPDAAPLDDHPGRGIGAHAVVAVGDGAVRDAQLALRAAAERRRVIMRHVAVADGDRRAAVHPDARFARDLAVARQQRQAGDDEVDARALRAEEARHVLRPHLRAGVNVRVLLRRAAEAPRRRRQPHDSERVARREYLPAHEDVAGDEDGVAVARRRDRGLERGVLLGHAQRVRAQRREQRLGREGAGGVGGANTVQRIEATPPPEEARQRAAGQILQNASDDVFAQP